MRRPNGCRNWGEESPPSTRRRSNRSWRCSTATTTQMAAAASRPCHRQRLRTVVVVLHPSLPMPTAVRRRTAAAVAGVTAHGELTSAAVAADVPVDTLRPSLAIGYPAGICTVVFTTIAPPSRARPPTRSAAAPVSTRAPWERRCSHRLRGHHTVSDAAITTVTASMRLTMRGTTGDPSTSQKLDITRTEITRYNNTWSEFCCSVVLKSTRTTLYIIHPITILRFCLKYYELFIIILISKMLRKITLMKFDSSIKKFDHEKTIHI